VGLLGRAAGRQLHALSHNRDPRRVVVGRRRRSIGTQRALGRRARSPGELDTILVGLVDRLGGRLRGADRVCRTVTLRLRFDDFMRATRSHTLPEPTDQTQAVLAVARGLLAEAMPMIRARGLTLMGITFSGLTTPDPNQLELASDRQAALDTATDSVRDRFGNEAITRAVLLGRDPGWTPPLLPDLPGPDGAPP